MVKYAPFILNEAYTGCLSTDVGGISWSGVVI